MLIREKALEIAIGYLGKEEEPRGSNGGPFVMGCLELVGISFPAPWCQSFVHRCYAEAAEVLGVANPVVKTGGVLYCWTKTGGVKLLPDQIAKHPEWLLPGYQFVMREGKATGHTGMIERMEGFLAHTIEGNTNADGSREGYAVMRKVRHVNQFQGVIEY